jgi:hypothetical protein
MLAMMTPEMLRMSVKLAKENPQLVNQAMRGQQPNNNPQVATRAQNEE